MNCNNINCVVTGASSGIGRELSLLLAEKGCTVLAVARTKERLFQLVSEAAHFKGKILPLVFDLENTDNYIHLTSLISARISSIDLLVNNAAVGHYASFSEQTHDEIMRVIKTTFIAPILTTKACLPMMQSSESSVMFVSSLAGKMGFPKLPIYSAAKHGLEGFADVLIQENEKRIYIFRPGVTKTKFFEKSGMTEFEKTAKEKGLMRNAKEVAKEMIYAIEHDKKNYTVGGDKFLLPLLPIISRNMRFTILDLLNKIDKITN